MAGAALHPVQAADDRVIAGAPATQVDAGQELAERQQREYEQAHGAARADVAEQLPVIDAAELATLLPRFREQYAEASGYRAREAKRWERKNPSAYVVAWMVYQHAQALGEDRERSVATALQAGEVELRTAAQIEVEQLRDLVRRLDVPSFYPPRYDEACALKQRREAARARAAEWRQANPRIARALDTVGLQPSTDLEFHRAREAMRTSPAVQEAAAWERAEWEREQLLADARQRLEQLLERLLSPNPEPQPPELEAPALEPQQEAVSAQRSLAAELAAMEQAPTEAAPEWIEWEQDGESYGQWDDEQQVYCDDPQAVEDRPEPELPQQRYRGPRMG